MIGTRASFVKGKSEQVNFEMFGNVNNISFTSDIWSSNVITKSVSTVERFRFYFRKKKKKVLHTNWFRGSHTHTHVTFFLLCW